MMFISEFTTVGGVLSVALFDEVQPVVTQDLIQTQTLPSILVADLAMITSIIGPDLPQPKPKLMEDQANTTVSIIGPDLPQPKPTGK